MSTKHKKNGKPIVVFVNGFKIVLSRQYLTKWEDVLKKVAKVLQPRFLVKRIVSEDSGFIIRNVADFEPNGKYIACGPTASAQNKFKRQLSDKATSSESHNKSNSRNLRDKNCTIYIFANGDYKRLKKFVFSQNSYFYWDFILGSIDIGFQSNFASLYTLYGQKLILPRQLKNGSYYVAVGEKESFCKLPYLRNYKTFKKVKEKIQKENDNTYGSVKSLVDSLAGFLNTNITCYSVHKIISGTKKSKEITKMNLPKSEKDDKRKQSIKLLRNPIDNSTCCNENISKKRSKANSETDKIIPCFANSSKVEEKNNSSCDGLEKRSSQASFYSAFSDISTSFIEQPEKKTADDVKNQKENSKAKEKGPSFGEPFYVSNKTQEKTFIEKQPYAAIKIVKTEISVQTEPIIRKSATTVTGSKSFEIASERRPTYSDIFRLVENATSTAPPKKNVDESYASSVVSYPTTYIQETWNRRSKEENVKPPKKQNIFAKCLGCQSSHSNTKIN